MQKTFCFTKIVGFVVAILQGYFGGAILGGCIKIFKCKLPNPDNCSKTIVQKHLFKNKNQHFTNNKIRVKVKIRVRVRVKYSLKELKKAFIK